MKKFLLLLIFLNGVQLSAQSNYGKVWMQGANKLFKSVFYLSGVQNTFLIQDSTYLKYFIHGNSNICDSAGNLILISNGYQIYDPMLNIIDGGDTLVPNAIYTDYNGFSIYSQTSIFLPLSNNQYYFIIPTASDSMNAAWYLPGATEAPFDLLWYNKIDMNANGGTGKVVKRKQPLLENVRLSKTGMMACRHGNGKDWWLMKPALDTNMIYTFLCTQDSIYLDTIQGFAEPHFGFWDTDGQTMFNQTGTKYASTYRHSPYIFLADFDRCSGLLSNPRMVSSPPSNKHNPFDTTLVDINVHEGIAFSPNGQFLYVASDFNIWQYELNNPDSATAWYHVAGLDTTWQQSQGYSSMYLGPDDKLYIGNWSGLSMQMSVIDNPDIKGAGCNFCPRCFRFPGIAATTPPCMPNYGLGADPCWPLSSSEIRDERNEMVVHPNPASTIIYIKTKSKEKRELYNSIGQLLFSTFPNSYKDEIDVSSLAKGLYYIKVGEMTRKLIVE
jgi:hypothetical protein